jgi:ankyrin repeat protein
VDVNARNVFGESALHDACWVAIELVALLLEFGADPGAVGQQRHACPVTRAGNVLGEDAVT